MLALMLGLQAYGSALAADPTPSAEGVNLLGWVSTVLGAVTVLGGGALAVWGGKTKKYSDSREDKTAEVQNFKTQIDAAIAMSTEARENAKEAIGSLKDSLGLAKQQLESANVTITAQQTTIVTLERIVAGLRSDQETARAEAEQQLDALRAQLIIQTEERNAAAARVEDLERRLHEREEITAHITTAVPIPFPSDVSERTAP